MKLLVSILAVAGGAAWLLRKGQSTPAVEPSPKIAPARKKPPSNPPPSTSMPNDVTMHTPNAGYLDRILTDLDNKTHRLERHEYMGKVVQQAYKERANKGTAKVLEYIAELHIKEFPKIRAMLKRDADGALPRVPTFQQYAIFLTEIGEYQRAIEVCQKALEHGLSDGTKGDFPERIKRIRRKQSAA